MSDITQNSIKKGTPCVKAGRLNYKVPLRDLITLHKHVSLKIITGRSPEVFWCKMHNEATSL